MAYTPSPNKLKTSPDNFGPLSSDSNRINMQWGNRMLTQDATASPQSSPLTVNTTNTLVVPQNAIQCTLVSTTNAVQVGEDSTSLASFSLPAGVLWTFDCSRQQNIYLKTASSTVVNFVFNCV